MRLRGGSSYIHLSRCFHFQGMLTRCCSFCEYTNNANGNIISIQSLARAPRQKVEHALRPTNTHNAAEENRKQYNFIYMAEWRSSLRRAKQIPKKSKGRLWRYWRTCSIISHNVRFQAFMNLLKTASACKIYFLMQNCENRANIYRYH